MMNLDEINRYIAHLTEQESKILAREDSPFAVLAGITKLDELREIRDLRDRAFATKRKLLAERHAARAGAR